MHPISWLLPPQKHEATLSRMLEEPGGMLSLLKTDVRNRPATGKGAPHTENSKMPVPRWVQV